MKYILYALLIGAIISCKREPLTTYNVDDNVYFNFSTYQDTLDFTFAYADPQITDTIIKIPIGVTGLAASVDRPFELVTDPSSTAIYRTHYELPQFVIPAGIVMDTLRILFKRTADLTTEAKTLKLRLKANDNFKTDIAYKIHPYYDTISVLSFSISFSDILIAGPYWGSVYARYFGTYSVKKMKFINELLAMPLDFWSSAPSTGAHYTQAEYYAATTARYLTEQRDSGNLIIDEDGSPMTMGPAYR